jgi:predicted nucleic acid-binding protein
VRAAVIDASFAAAWLLADEASDQADRVLEQAERGAIELLAPSLFAHELTNILLNASRRRRLSATQLQDALQVATQLDIALESADFSQCRAVAELAQEHRLTAYDAAYLELAIRRRCPLLSLDRALRQAAEASDIPTGIA